MEEHQAERFEILHNWIFTRTHLKIKILVQDQGGAEVLKRGPNADIGPKDYFEIGSTN